LLSTARANNARASVDSSPVGPLGAVSAEFWTQGAWWDTSDWGNADGGGAQASLTPTSNSDGANQSGFAWWVDDPPDESLEALLGAKDLPGAGSFAVNGQLDSTKNQEYYRLPIDLAGGPVKIEVRSREPASPLADGVTLFDETGHKLMQSMPGPGAFSIAVSIPAGMLDTRGNRIRAIYLKIEAAKPWTPGDDGTSPASPSPDSETQPGAGYGGAITDPGSNQGSSYILVVKRQTNNTPYNRDPWQNSSGNVQAPPEPKSSEATTEAGYGGGGGLRGDDFEPLSTVATGLSPAPARVASGPLPSFSAAPLGGILAASDDLTPPVSQGDTLVVDLALQDLPRVNTPGRPEAVEGGEALAFDDPARHEAESEGALVVLRGSGGFPLFGATLVAGAHGDEPPGPDEGGLPVFAFAPTEAPTPVAEPEGLSPLPEPVKDDGVDAVRRVSATAGVTVAIAFVTGVALPDLTDPTRAKPSAQTRLRRILSRRLARAAKKSPERPR